MPAVFCQKVLTRQESGGGFFDRYGFEPGMEEPLVVDGKLNPLAEKLSQILGSFYIWDNSACVLTVIDVSSAMPIVGFNYDGDGNNTVAFGG